MKIAVITSRFNRSITTKLREGCLARLAEQQITPSHDIEVPGAVELPLVATWLAEQKSADAIICLGAVIRGETTHYDYVCQQASQGCQQVMLQYQLPVIFGVLTTETTEQALDRVGGKHGHKGADAADCAVEMLNLHRHLFT